MDIITTLKAVAIAFNSFKNNYKVDKNGRELFENFTRSLDKSFISYEIKYDFLCGKDTLKVDGITENYTPVKGDTVIIDVSVFSGETWCDVARTFFVGEYSKAQEEVFDTVKRSLREGEKQLKNGVFACDIYNAVNSVFIKKGKKLIHHAGHRIGAKPLMQPQFLPNVNTKIESGLLYTIESGLYGDFGIRLENDYLIENDGAVNLFEDFLPLNIKEYVLNE